MATPKEKTEAVVDETVLAPVEVKESRLTIADYKLIVQQKDEAIKFASNTIERQREEIKNQVDRYNTDFEKIFNINKNLLAYNENKTKAVLKVLEGLTDLIKLDTKEGENNGN